MKVVTLFINSFFLLASVFAKEKANFKSNIEKKIASPFQEAQGNKLFENFLKCKMIKKEKNHFTKISYCMKNFFSQKMTDSMKIDLIVFMIAGNNFSSLRKCQYHELVYYPSVYEDKNDFVLCSSFNKEGREKKDIAIIFFNKRGYKLEILNIKN